jgi:hypothetical protein
LYITKTGWCDSMELCLSVTYPKQAFLKKWWVESDHKASNLPLSLRLIEVLNWLQLSTIVVFIPQLKFHKVSSVFIKVHTCSIKKDPKFFGHLFISGLLVWEYSEYTSGLQYVDWSVKLVMSSSVFSTSSWIVASARSSRLCYIQCSLFKYRTTWCRQDDNWQWRNHKQCIIQNTTFNWWIKKKRMLLISNQIVAS